MNSDTILATLQQHRLVPVVVCDSVDQAGPLADSLHAGGLPVAEVTLRTPAAIEVISAMARQPDLVVGAGTVLSAEQAQQAIDCGAKFIVSPGLDEGVVQKCRDLGVPVVPGVATATELQRAVNLGLDVLKFFPAEAIGGVKLLKALKGPFPGVRFVPTGGVSDSNVRDYLSVPEVLACGGSWMVRRDWMREGDWSSLTACVRQAVALVQSSTGS